MYYTIRLQGQLDPSWQDRFGGLCIEQQETGTTLLSGTLPDQAALHGVLLQIVRLGLTLLSLETSESKRKNACTGEPVRTRWKSKQGSERETC
ncbi:MAG TPA: hypothetical protein VFV38_53260 [Ktedonobacteraceae bacterium]|nr:hypothetical protein [Ktedonobacteraceae bacterium]